MSCTRITIDMLYWLLPLFASTGWYWGSTQREQSSRELERGNVATNEGGVSLICWPLPLRVLSIATLPRPPTSLIQTKNWWVEFEGTATDDNWEKYMYNNVRMIHVYIYTCSRQINKQIHMYMYNTCTCAKEYRWPHVHHFKSHKRHISYHTINSIHIHVHVTISCKLIVPYNYPVDILRNNLTRV